MSAPILIKDIPPLVDCFRNCGVDIVNNEDKRIIKYPIHLTLCTLGAAMWYYAMAEYSITYYNDVDKLVATMTILLQLSLTIMKLTYFFAQKQRFMQLNAASNELVYRANDIETQLWNAEIRLVRITTSIYLGACMGTTAVCLSAPLLQMLYMYLRYDEVVYPLPVPGIFPYDTHTPFNYFLTFILMVLFTVFGVSCMVATDGIFSWYVFGIAGHMQILRHKLAQMIQNGMSANFRNAFEELILYHQHVIDLANEFDALFAFIIFSEVTFSSMQLCFIVYEFAFSADAASLPFFVMLASTIMIQLLIFCFGGEKVKNESEFTCEQFYMLTPWHSLPPKVRRLFLLPLMRSQKPLSLTGYFFTANRSLLVWIFRTAGSFTALLFAMKSKQ